MLNLTKVVLATVLAVMLVACVDSTKTTTSNRPAAEAPELVAKELGETKNVHVYDGIWLCGQPRRSDFEWLAEQGVKTIINLRPAAEQPDVDERAMARELGMTYHNPAFGGPVPLTDAVFDEALAVLAQTDEPLIMHCSSGNRVGAIWMAHRVLNDGIPYDAALAEAKQVGLRSEEYEAKAKAYIEARVK